MIVLEMVITEMYLQPKMVLIVLNIVVTDGANLLFSYDGEEEGVLETVDVVVGGAVLFLDVVAGEAVLILNVVASEA